MESKPCCVFQNESLVFWGLEGFVFVPSPPQWIKPRALLYMPAKCSIPPALSFVFLNLLYQKKYFRTFHF